jgi:1-acyl-sn-glycerol-3-phosphate acyltransferase
MPDSGGLYAAMALCFTGLLRVLFREIKVHGAHDNVPAEGPVIFVCAPHANQVG